MNDDEAVRERVSRDYARLVSAPPRRSRCGEAQRKGTAVKVAGYVEADLSAVPDDAVINAMGCGNPVAFAGVREGDVVVDLGSGAGIDLLLAGKRVGPSGRVIGIDMTDAMIARAEENIERSGLENIEVRKGLIEDLPVDAESVDWLISNCVINLSPEKARVFGEIARVLKPGGRLSISDIVVDELPESLRHDPRLLSGCMARAISEAQYRQGLADAGLIDISVTDRVVYTTDQLLAMRGSSEDRVGAEEARAIARALTGRLWSAQFVATKPKGGSSP